jgi:hypothetical protein
MLTWRSTKLTRPMSTPYSRIPRDARAIGSSNLISAMGVRPDACGWMSVMSIMYCTRLEGSFS